MKVNFSSARHHAMKTNGGVIVNTHGLLTSVGYKLDVSGQLNAKAALLPGKWHQLLYE
jgi:hypothetical protein